MLRLFRILLLTFLLAILIWYGHTFYPAVTLQMCLANPELHDGSTIVVGNEATIQEIYDDGFLIEQMGKKVRVISSEQNVRLGEFVILKAVFHKPNLLEALEVRIAKKRRAKIWLSVIPALLVVAYFMKRFRFNVRQFYFEERA